MTLLKFGLSFTIMLAEGSSLISYVIPSRGKIPNVALLSLLNIGSSLKFNVLTIQLGLSDLTLCF